jgi:NAD(P)-dependent dehydrogenase (short-subunit alcohol dehydrogenase family)
MEPISSLTGKTIVITGASSGIGFEAARELAGRGAMVIGVGRSAERCAKAEQTILADFPAARISYVLADLSSQRQVRAAAEKIRVTCFTAGEGKLDVLINNAGGMASWYMATEDGYELQFAVNHLAPFLLTHELLAHLKAAPSARIITVSSASHRFMRINWGDVMMRKFYNPLLAYKQSKLANVLFSYQLNRRLKDIPICAYAVDPGLVNTTIGQKGTTGIVNWIWKIRRLGGVDPRLGAATVIYLASEPSVEGKRDVYWKDCRPISPSRYAQREDVAARLWGLSERLCGITSPVILNETDFNRLAP